MHASNTSQHGQALMIAVVFFLVISLTIVLGLGTALAREVAIGNTFFRAHQSVYLAEALTEDIVYRLNSSKDVDASEELSLDGTTATAIVADTFDGKTITVSGEVNNAIRRIETEVQTGAGAAFHYGIQAGNGGFSIDGGSVIEGNVYANGNIVGDGGARINGSAIAANSAALSADQVNDAPITPTAEVVFGNTNTTQDFAQSFQVTETGPLNNITFYIKRTASTPANPTVRIVHDNSGVPGSTQVASQTLSASLVTTSFGWVEVTFPNYPQLIAGETYWMVIDAANNTNRYFTIAANTTYANGTGKIGRYGSSWNNTTPAGLDGYFRVYMGGIISSIAGVDGSWDLRVAGDSWAHEVHRTNTIGTLYCQSGTGNAGGKTCDTSRPDPSPVGMPISEALINQWKAEGEGGVVVPGDYTVGWQGTTTGPTVINGDLLVNGGGTITLTGTLYVKGNVTFTGGGKLNLHSSYGSSSGVLIADGRMSIAGGGQFSGSGQSGSYPLAITTSDCPNGASCGGSNAIHLSGGAGAVVLVGQNGTVRMDGGGTVKALTGYRLEISGGGTVIYESGLAELSFSSGPGGAFNIERWEEVL